MNNLKKFKSREVFISHVAIGANNPIRIQSMTNTKTEDIKATTSQILALEEAGCEIARVTVQGKKQAYALEGIKNALLKKNSKIPLVADIHFYPPAAYIAADFVDKIRINPGNFAEKRAVFKETLLTETQYQDELKKIEEKLVLLIDKLKKNKVALRIGVNHGSLSDRIMTRYGNTITGMVLSAIEYTNILRKHDYHSIVFSMKCSSSFLTIEAYRALVNEMLKLGWDYPLHLGVTEAGDKDDGIIKSSVGIGALLLDGIGDTIRVSLTENPTKEIKPAKRLVKLCSNRSKEPSIEFINNSNPIKSFLNKKTLLALKINKSGELATISNDKLNLIDIFYVENFKTSKEDLELIKKLKSIKKTIISKLDIEGITKTYSLETYPKNSEARFALEITPKDDFEKLKKLNPLFIVFKLLNSNIEKAREFRSFIQENNINTDIILDLKYTGSLEDIKILASSEIGLILYEKLANGILLETQENAKETKSQIDILELSLNILQACNLKKYKTEFIACPSCGRTLFNIQKALKKIKEKTSHLPDLKIAVMGCIVNGPGEMQGSDFGYIGANTGKIDLYVNQKCVEKNIDEKDAVDKLISLIKKQGKWKEKINSYF
ncbi:MAG: 4-hydroxy-3-methylbut-2-en-1-yl diphosphate synthase (ferredoxin) [Candidatus Anoxychlamydiales bacterium]|nr:4-hydroxy-3-methylbut-2-en-1-yl diphosphate synthase (ferredoxin) [Candidatus Anoxychlamydiales bacterium]